MTYTLTLTPYLAAMLDAACRATGLDTLHLFRAHLSPATGATPAEESPAVPAAPAGLPAVKKLPLPQPPSLTGPGDILDADTIDWTNPNLYK